VAERIVETVFGACMPDRAAVGSQPFNRRSPCILKTDKGLGQETPRGIDCNHKHFEKITQKTLEKCKKCKKGQKVPDF
jgi:hypothetical protein